MDSGRLGEKECLRFILVQRALLAFEPHDFLKDILLAFLQLYFHVPKIFFRFS